MPVLIINFIFYILDTWYWNTNKLFRKEIRTCGFGMRLMFDITIIFSVLNPLLYLGNCDFHVLAPIFNICTNQNGSTFDGFHFNLSQHEYPDMIPVLVFLQFWATFLNMASTFPNTIMIFMVVFFVSEVLRDLM